MLRIEATQSEPDDDLPTETRVIVVPTALVTVSTRIPENLRDRIADMAATQRRTQSQMLRILLEDALDYASN